MEKSKGGVKMKTMYAMLCSIMIVMAMMMSVAVFINYLEGDILPDTSPWSFISFDKQEEEEVLKLG